MTLNDLKPGMLLQCKDNNYLVLPYGPGYVGAYSLCTGRIQFEKEDWGKNLNDVPYYGILKVYNIPDVGSLLGPNWFETEYRDLLWEAN